MNQPSYETTTKYFFCTNDNCEWRGMPVRQTVLIGRPAFCEDCHCEMTVHDQAYTSLWSLNEIISIPDSLSINDCTD